MSTTPLTRNDVEKPGGIEGGDVAHVVQPTRESYLRQDAVPEPHPRLRTYHALRITLLVFSFVIMALSVAGIIFGIIIGAAAGKYSGYDRHKKEKEKAGGDPSTEGGWLSEGLYEVLYFFSMAFSLYCFVVTLVCFILTLVRSHRVLAPGCFPSACLIIAVAIGVAITAGEITVYLSLPPEGVEGLCALPIIRAVLLVVYLVLVACAACLFNGHAEFYYCQS